MSMSNEQPASVMPGLQSMQMQAPQGASMAQPGMAAQPGMVPQGAMAGQPGMMTQPGMMPQPAMMQGGHLYIQTNEIRNCVIHYFRAPDANRGG
jgi:hypothetical protein